MTSIIKKRVYLDPRYLDEKIMDHLLQRIIELYVGECTKEYGHILSVKKIIEILHNEDTIFTLLFEAETLKPDVGNVLEGTVCMLYKDGIFTQVSEKQKMLIPNLSIKGYTYDETFQTYSNGKNKIKEGDKIKAVVTASQYNKKNFSCIGCLV
jgi:DNA-directed RNA polymerase subunit E'/Rpb7